MNNENDSLMNEADDNDLLRQEATEGATASPDEYTGDTTDFSNYTPERTRRSRPVSGNGTRRILSFLLAAILVFAGGTFGGFLYSRYLSGRTGGNVVMYQSVVRPAEENEEPAEAMSVKQVAEMAENSVVLISTESIQTSIFMQQYVTSGAGSGVIISEDGYIVTNYHVISGASKISVKLADDTVYEAAVVASDEYTDIAILKIDASGLSPALFGDSNLLEAGDNVVVIGNPLGELGGSVSHGVISATDRVISVEGIKMTLLQTDAAINPGNSGGGMFNMYGELIGIVNCKSTGSSIDNLGFAIPSNTAKEVIEELLNYGYVTGRAFLGIATVDITDVFTAMQYRVENFGVYVTSVSKGSCAETAGINVGDIILSIGDTDVSSSTDISNILLGYSAGEEITVRIQRDGKEKSLTVILDEYVPEN